MRESDLKRLDEFVAELKDAGLNRPWGYDRGCYDTVVRDLTVLVDYERPEGIRVGVYANYPAEHDPIGWLEDPSVPEVREMIDGLVKERAS